MHWYQSGMTGGWFIMMLIPLVIVGIVVYLLLDGKNDSGRRDRREDRALEILDERFANGEIDEEEYRKKKELLRKS